MGKITLKNDLDGKDVQIKEGNAGITRVLKILKPNDTYVITHDPNATYREYVFITLPDKTQLRVMTSDDFDKCTEISIFEKDGTYDWAQTSLRKTATIKTAEAGPGKRFFQALFSKMGF